MGKSAFLAKHHDPWMVRTWRNDNYAKTYFRTLGRQIIISVSEGKMFGLQIQKGGENKSCNSILDCFGIDVSTADDGPGATVFTEYGCVRTSVVRKNDLMFFPPGEWTTNDDFWGGDCTDSGSQHPGLQDFFSVIGIFV